MASWWVEYTQEVGNYLLDNGALVTDLFYALESLTDTDRIPLLNYRYVGADEILWEAADHFIFYRRIEEDKRIIVAAVRPLP